jgi:O-glycosyl hydrolase
MRQILSRGQIFVSCSLAILLILSLNVLFITSATNVERAYAAGPPACGTGNTPPCTPTPGGTNPTPTPSPTSGPNPTVSIWLTKGDKSALLQPQTNVTFGADTTRGALIHVNENHVYQQMEGFGAAMTDSSAWLIYNKLSASQREALMGALFSSTEGIGISYVRVPMGASDFALNHYTYDDTCCNLSDFSIAHDTAYIIPVLLQARSINPSLKLMGSPWSAPGWMKTTNALYKGALRPEYYAAYATYFANFVDAYAASGVPLNSVTIQNEPQHTPADYPGMWMTPNEEISFVKDHLGPALAGRNVKIIALDHNWPLAYYGVDVLNDESARSYVAGTAFHCYGGIPDFQSITRDAHRDKGIYFTECSSGNWATNWADNLVWDGVNLVVGATRNWSQAAIKWNIALDQNFGPHTGGCSGCTGLVTIDQTNGAVTFNHDYYSIGHASKFVVPGAYRIASTNLPGNNLHTTAFKNPDGSKVLIVVNAANAGQTIKVRWGGKSFQYSIPGKSMATFKWNGTQGTPAAPAAPTALTANAQSSQVHLKWEFSYLGATYNVNRATTSGGPYMTLATGLALPEYVDMSVTNGTTYYYVVSAVNANGESANSTQVLAAPNVPPTFGATTQIEAEKFVTQYGIGIENCSDQSGCGQSIGYTETGDYLSYNVNFGSGVSTANIRVASGSTGGTVELRLGSPTGTLIASIPVTNTGGWGTWTTRSASVTGATGMQVLYLVFQGEPAETASDGMLNLNWFRFN